MDPHPPFIMDRFFVHPIGILEYMTTGALKELVVKRKMDIPNYKNLTSSSLCVLIKEYISRNNINYLNLRRVKVCSRMTTWYEMYSNIVSFAKTYGTEDREYYTHKYDHSEYQLVYDTHTDVWTSERLFYNRIDPITITFEGTIKLYNELRRVVKILEIQYVYLMIIKIMKNVLPKDVIDYTHEIYCKNAISLLKL